MGRGPANLQLRWMPLALVGGAAIHAAGSPARVSVVPVFAYFLSGGALAGGRRCLVLLEIVGEGRERSFTPFASKNVMPAAARCRACIHRPVIAGNPVAVKTPGCCRRQAC